MIRSVPTSRTLVEKRCCGSIVDRAENVVNNLFVDAGIRGFSSVDHNVEPVRRSIAVNPTSGPSAALSRNGDTACRTFSVSASPDAVEAAGFAGAVGGVTTSESGGVTKEAPQGPSQMASLR